MKIYMDQSLGFVTKGQEHKVCHLKRSLYLKFHEAIMSNGLTIIEEDHYTYVKWTKDEIIFFSSYVDDILLTRNNIEMINATKEWLA